MSDNEQAIVWDKRDLGYKGSIRDFMTCIGEGGCVIGNNNQPTNK